MSISYNGDDDTENRIIKISENASKIKHLSLCPLHRKLGVSISAFALRRGLATNFR
jgi:hypothetical protein